MTQCIRFPVSNIDLFEHVVQQNELGCLLVLEPEWELSLLQVHGVYHTVLAEYKQEDQSM